VYYILFSKLHFLASVRFDVPTNLPWPSYFCRLQSSRVKYDLNGPAQSALKRGMLGLTMVHRLRKVQKCCVRKRKRAALIFLIVNEDKLLLPRLSKERAKDKIYYHNF
jgi:hypothetical protein